MASMRALFYRLLRSSERFFGTDMVYAGTGGLWLTGGQFATTLLAFVLAVALANFLEPEKYGNYKYILSLADVIGVFTLTGLTTAVTRAAARGCDGSLGTAFKRSLTWSISMLVIAGALGAYYLTQGNALLGIGLLVIGATMPLIVAASLYRPFLMGRGEFKWGALGGILQNGVPLLAVLITVFFTDSVLALIAAYFVSNLLVVTLLYRLAMRTARNREQDPAMVGLGNHLSVMGIISTIASQFDSILVFQSLGGAALAAFSLATAIPDVIRGTFKNVDALAMPKFAGKSKEEMKRAVWSKFPVLLFMTLTIGTAYALAAPYLFSLFFPAYMSAVPLSQVYALILPLSFMLASAYFDSQAAVKERYILNIFNSTTRIGFTLIGIYFFGLWGAIAGRLVSRFFNVLLSAYLIARH